MRSSVVKKVRGQGLRIGCQRLAGTRSFCEALREQGILRKAIREKVIRFAPPLTITHEEIDGTLDRLLQ